MIPSNKALAPYYTATQAATWCLPRPGTHTAAFDPQDLKHQTQNALLHTQTTGGA